MTYPMHHFNNLFLSSSCGPFGGGVPPLPTEVGRDAGVSEAGQIPSRADGSQVPPRADGGSVQDGGIPFIPKSPPVVVRRVNVQGDLQTLFAGENGCYGITSEYVNGSPQYTLRSIHENGVEQPMALLPATGNRFYGESYYSKTRQARLASYESTGLDNPQHGYAYVDANDRVTDCNFYNDPMARLLNGNQPLTRPGELIEWSGKIYFLFNNCNEDVSQNAIPCVRNSALVEISNPQSCMITDLVILPAQNANGLALLKNASGEDRLIIAAAGDVWATRQAQGKIVVVDPVTKGIERVMDSTAGVGIGLSASNHDHSKVVFTGQGKDRFSLTLYNNAFHPLLLPPEIQNPFISGAAFYGNGILLNTMPMPGVVAYLFNPETGRLESLGAANGFFPMPFQEYAQGKYCSGSSGSAPNQSEVVFWGGI